MLYIMSSVNNIHTITISFNQLHVNQLNAYPHFYVYKMFPVLVVEIFAIAYVWMLNSVCSTRIYVIFLSSFMFIM